MSENIIKQETVESDEANTSHLLSREETREILTPFAFEIDKTLFGIKLAAPHKRAFAILIDLLAIAILSGAPGELLAIVLAVTTYKLGSKPKVDPTGKIRSVRRRRISRFIGAFIIFVLLIDVLPKLVEQFEPEEQESGFLQEGGIVATSDTDLASTLILAATTKNIIDVVNKSGCQSLSCWQTELLEAINFEALAKIKVEEEFAIEAFESVAEKTGLNTEDQKVLVEVLLLTFKDANSQYLLERKDLVTADDGLPNAEDNSLVAPDVAHSFEQENSMMKDDKEAKPIYSIMEYVKGIIDDLGLGFGWAAFYFTVLTSIWKGQTLGKKLFSIRVIQLDGTPLSLWESFGRYGGYGAGLATGLLGFIQIYWDANRQAIHDQISATVVVDTKQPDFK